MSKTQTTKQGQAWDQLARDAYGSEKRLGTLFTENSDNLDVVFFAGDVTVSLPEADEKTTVVSVPPWERL